MLNPRLQYSENVIRFGYDELNKMHHSAHRRTKNRPPDMLTRLTGQPFPSGKPLRVRWRHVSSKSQTYRNKRHEYFFGRR